MRTAFTPGLIDFPDIMARRALGADAAHDDTREGWIVDSYLGAFPSKEVCVARLVDDYDLLGYGMAPTPDYDVAALTTDLFEDSLYAIREGDAFHVFTRH